MMIVKIKSQAMPQKVVARHGRLEKALLHVAGQVGPNGERRLSDRCLKSRYIVTHMYAPLFPAVRPSAGLIDDGRACGSRLRFQERRRHSVGVRVRPLGALRQPSIAQAACCC
jgi:hypothetical protein